MKRRAWALLCGSGLFPAAILAGQLTLAPEITLLSVNGHPVSPAVTRIPLAEGPQLMTVRYEQLFELDAEQHDLVRSPVQWLRFEAQPDADYHLAAPPMTWHQARYFVKEPWLQLQDDEEHPISHSLSSQEALWREVLLGRTAMPDP